VVEGLLAVDGNTADGERGQPAIGVRSSWSPG
jgi:hypothetical protein